MTKCALLVRSLSLPPEVGNAKFPFNVEPTNESFQLLIVQGLEGFLEKVGHETEKLYTGRQEICKKGCGMYMHQEHAGSTGNTAPEHGMQGLFGTDW